MRKNYRKSRQSYPDGVLLISDSGSKQFDRYLVLYKPEGEGINSYFPYFGMSENPHHPQGFGQHGEMQTRYSVWGTNDKVIEFHELPVDCQKAVLQDLKETNHATT